MAEAFGWGAVAGSSLVIGAGVALVFNIRLRVIGLIMAFGAGVLISAVAFDLVEEAADKSTGSGSVLAGIFAGCLVFFEPGISHSSLLASCSPLGAGSSRAEERELG